MSKEDEALAENGKDQVMVSFRLEREMKEAVNEAAKRHGRTIGGQFAQSLADGMRIQELIKRVSDHLTEKIVVDEKVFVYEPDEDKCIDFIIAATDLTMERMQRERDAAENGKAG